MKTPKEILQAPFLIGGSLVEWFPRINRHHDQAPNPKFNKQDSSLENHRESPRHQFNSVEEGSGAMYLTYLTAKEACRNGGAFVILHGHFHGVDCFHKNGLWNHAQITNSELPIFCCRSKLL